MARELAESLLKESILISRDSPVLDKNTASTDLVHFFMLQMFFSMITVNNLFDFVLVAKSSVNNCSVL